MTTKKPLCAFGEKIEIRLVEINQTNAWLIDEVSKDTGRYFDRSYLHKIKTGEIATTGIIASICKILEIDVPKQKSTISDRKEEREMNADLKNQINETHARSEHLKSIALKLLEQLKGERISFEDACRVLKYLRSAMDEEARNRLL